ncbi:Zn2/Cys6 DNA-binding protein [Glarea lozoyensis ATCC 20868]|uniref:Zn2/Cys6 DNA-binding protein n=1 Tax=Glarea lozoyensis (strain ATCC 20868 / MF5171) TaxID=1116229 RepID=S3CXW4_GLAL2|nr:Zn2/Cys6 DNA-binding protein [Glarea lozoyensis ATCC 20868]EPE31177.1 Zn2/Cys6 DNA-binding protein [Glarea lozoyensis ATCC 20868]
MRPLTVDTGKSKKIIETMDSGSEQRAPQVCSHCKSIKKGCDKRLPSCSQCLKRRAVCRYGEPSEPRRYGDEVANSIPAIDSSSSPSTWTSIPRPVLGRLNPSMRVSILLMNSMSEMIQASVLEPNVSQSVISTDAIFQSQVYHIIRADDHYIEDVVNRYFNGVHTWIPIISRKRFVDRFRIQNIIPTADFSILLLVMRLLAQFPSPDPDIDQEREILYLATKTLFTQVQPFVPISLALVQAGILLSRYEQAHGMIDAAYITCGTASRMAFTLNLHNAGCSTALQGSDNWLDEEQALSTWWGLVICDRTIAYDSRMEGRPLATRSIREEEYLPLEAEEMAGTAPVMSPRYRYFVSATTLLNIGTFGRECQSTYILEKAQTAIQDPNFNQDKLMTLGLEMQSLLSTVMNQTAGRWGPYHGATKNLILGMYTLHCAALKSESIRHAETVKATLDTVTRMVIDIARAFNASSADCDLETLAPTIAHIVRCAQQHIATCTDPRIERWLRDFEALRRMLGFFAGRWLGAAHELRVINQTADSVLSRR